MQSIRSLFKNLTVNRKKENRPDIPGILKAYAHNHNAPILLKIWKVLVEIAQDEGGRHPEIHVSGAQLAEQVDASPKTCRKWLNKLVSKFNLLKVTDKDAQGKRFFKVIWNVARRPDKNQKQVNRQSSKGAGTHSKDQNRYKPYKDLIQYIDPDNPNWRQFAMSLFRKNCKEYGLNPDWLKFFGKLLLKIKISCQKAVYLLKKMSMFAYYLKDEGLDYCWQGFFVAWQTTQNFFKELHRKKETEKQERKQKQAKKEAVPMPSSFKQKLKKAEVI